MTKEDIINDLKKLGLYTLLRETDPIYGPENSRTLRQLEIFVFTKLDEYGKECFDDGFNLCLKQNGKFHIK